LNDAVLECRILPASFAPAYLGSIASGLFLPTFRPLASITASVAVVNSGPPSNGPSSNASSNSGTSTSNTPGTVGNASVGNFSFGLSAYNTGAGALFGFNLGMVAGTSSGPRAGGGSGGYGGESGVSPAGSPGGPPAVGITLVDPLDTSGNNLPYLLDSPGRATAEVPAESPPMPGQSASPMPSMKPPSVGPSMSSPFGGWRDQLIHPPF
jgi:hypothetical protein